MKYDEEVHGWHISLSSFLATGVGTEDIGKGPQEDVGGGVEDGGISR